MAKFFLALFSCKMCQSQCPLGITRFGPRKSSLFGNIINPLLAKLVCSRCLNIVFSLFFTLLLTSTSSRSIKKKIKQTNTHTYILHTKNLANIEPSWSNMRIFIYFSKDRHQKGKFWHQEDYNRHIKPSNKEMTQKWGLSSDFIAAKYQVFKKIEINLNWLFLVKIEIRTSKRSKKLGNQMTKKGTRQSVFGLKQAGVEEKRLRGATRTRQKFPEIDEILLSKQKTVETCRLPTS